MLSPPHSTPENATPLRFTYCLIASATRRCRSLLAPQSAIASTFTSSDFAAGDSDRAVVADAAGFGTRFCAVHEASDKNPTSATIPILNPFMMSTLSTLTLRATVVASARVLSSERMPMKRSLLLSLACLIVTTAALRAAPPESVNLRRTVVVDVAERTKDAVVYISTRKLISQRFSPFGDPLFDQFAGPESVRRVPAGSLGSGFIVHPDGYIVTNNHVVDRARQIEVELLDGRKLPADLVSADQEADLAILKIQSDNPLPALELGDSSDLLVGEPVIAVGNPFGFSHSV